MRSMSLDVFQGATVGGHRRPRAAGAVACCGSRVAFGGADRGVFALASRALDTGLQYRSGRIVELVYL
jgi:hypothetical protein